METTEGLADELVTCPHCAEDVKAEAKVCKHCGRRFSDYDQKGRRLVPWWAFVVVLAVAVLLGGVLAKQATDNAHDKSHQEICEISGGWNC